MSKPKPDEGGHRVIPPGSCTWCGHKPHVDVGIQMLGWIHQDHLRPVVELTDDDGRVDQAGHAET